MITKNKYDNKFVESTILVPGDWDPFGGYPSINTISYFMSMERTPVCR